jgi:hypothetical protein
MPFRTWSTTDVARELKVLGFGQYTWQFLANEIYGPHLPALNEAHLKEMGVASIGHRILMLCRFADIANHKPVAAIVLLTPAKSKPAQMPIQSLAQRKTLVKRPNPPTKTEAGSNAEGNCAAAREAEVCERTAGPSSIRACIRRGKCVLRLRNAA